jgi:hypothetical protein
MAMSTTSTPELVKQKLATFAEIQTEFERCFRFKQEVHGQKRFTSFPIDQLVFYLHALWLCECKDRLLSVYKNIRRYAGERSLELLQAWQEGDNAGVVAFLLQTLEIQSIADFTAQIDRAQQHGAGQGALQRLEQGRQIQLNRGINLMHALEAISALSPVRLLDEVRQACERYGHTPAQLQEQLAAMATPVYTYRPHALLAQKNMTVMNHLDMDGLARGIEGPHAQAWLFKAPEQPRAPFAEQIIPGYLQMLAPQFNNVRGVRFVDRSEAERE